MPIISSKIIEDSTQGNKRRITEQHTDSVGKNHLVSYMCESDFNVTAAMDSRVAHINQQLIDSEIASYIDRIENGLNVIGEAYTETTQKYRALQFLLWAKDMVKQKNFQALQYANLVIDPYSETQINTLLEGTQFENKADKIKTWILKIKDMKSAIDDNAIAAGDV